MATLTAEIKASIVQALACFDPPSKVAEAVRDKFGVVVSRQSVETYDPTKRAGRDLAKRWKEMFDDARAKFQAATVDIPVANRSYRLRVLGRMAEEAEERGQLVQAMEILEQAAKECGDMYLNRRRQAAELADRRGPLVVQQSHIVEYTLSPSGSH